jgi:hypothetical protein
MPFSLLANPTLAMLIELVPLAFVTISIVAIAATAAASNRFNESPRIGVVAACGAPIRARFPGYGGCIGTLRYLRYTLDASLTDYLQQALRECTMPLSHPATHPFCDTAHRAD